MPITWMDNKYDLISMSLNKFCLLRNIIKDHCCYVKDNPDKVKVVRNLLSSSKPFNGTGSETVIRFAKQVQMIVTSLVEYKDKFPNLSINFYKHIYDHSPTGENECYYDNIIPYLCNAEVALKLLAPHFFKLNHNGQLDTIISHCLDRTPFDFDRFLQSTCIKAYITKRYEMSMPLDDMVTDEDMCKFIEEYSNYFREFVI
ncbi:MAG: hypothetical protein ACRC5M_04565 [Anaeroplasmataceae bacterium]